MTRDVLVLDASPLVHFARSGELDTLAECLKHFDCVTTHAVRGELRRGAERHPAIRATLDLDWLGSVSCDELDTLYLFGKYMNRLGNLERNAGEASVLAWAERHSAIVMSTTRWRATWAVDEASESSGRSI